MCSAKATLKKLCMQVRPALPLSATRTPRMFGAMRSCTPNGSLADQVTALHQRRAPTPNTCLNAAAGVPIVDNVERGFNASVLAYGTKQCNAMTLGSGCCPVHRHALQFSG